MKSGISKRERRPQTPLNPFQSDRRGALRFRVQLRSFVSEKSSSIEQMGLVLDLSLTGCRVRAPLAVYPSLVMELRIYAPDLDWPIMIDKAVVRWVKGDTFGLQFLEMRQGEQDRLGWVIAGVAEERKQ